MQQRCPRPDVLATDTALRRGHHPFCLLDLALAHKCLGQLALRLGEVALLVRGPQAADRVAVCLLREDDVTALCVDRSEVGERPAVAAG